MPSPAKPEDKFVEANGLNLHYLDWGGGDGGVVVLLHGITGNAHDWDDIAPALTRHYRVLSLDLRGHGDSQWSKGSYWPQDYAADLDAVVQRLRIAPFDLIGHSLGSWVAMAYGGEHWRDLRRVLLSDFGPEVGREAARGIRNRASSPPMGFRSREEAAAWIRDSYSPPRPPGQAERRAAFGLRENWAGRLVWKHDPELTWLTGSAGLKATPYLWQQLRRIQCPVLVMRGEHSDLLTPEIQAKMLAACPRATAAEVKGVGHYLYDNPKAMLEAVLGFLRG